MTAYIGTNAAEVVKGCAIFPGKAHLGADRVETSSIHRARTPTPTRSALALRSTAKSAGQGGSGELGSWPALSGISVSRRNASRSPEASALLLRLTKLRAEMGVANQRRECSRMFVKNASAI